MSLLDISNNTTKAHNVNKIAEKHEYDIQKLDDFLTAVFDELEEDENILTWMETSNVPRFPQSDEEMLEKLKRVPLPKALYYATSTVTRDKKDGRLYNRKALFKRLHVIVLDDIGTKIPLSKIPEGFEPTYIIESSKGNFQYGYVLKVPLDKLELAEALIELVYSSGVSDTGGKMVNKLVRLPDGINGKEGIKGQFKVNLTSFKPDNLWTPEEILKALDIPVKWSNVVEDTNHAMKRTRIRTQGASLWSPIPAQAASLNGVIDPLYEWMLEHDMVKQEANDWNMIRCPWHDLHTSGDDVAYYSPLGKGVNDFKKMRSFKCFHEHCSGHDVQDLMDELTTLGAPIVPKKELNPELFRDYVYDPIRSGIWKIKADSPPLFLPAAGAVNVLVNKIEYKDEQGRIRRMKEFNYFMNSHHKVVVHGQTYDPSTPDIVVKDKHGTARLNMFYTPDWGDGAYDMEIVKKFIDYVKYLIPEPADQEFFIDWLSAKCQDLGFRGQAIIMIAVTQGMGRTTLSKLLGRLIGEHNMESVPFDVLTGDKDFNEWQTRPLIITDETLAVAKDDSVYKVYERLKEKVDTTPKKIRVNPKYGTQYEQMSHASYLMFSNHLNAMHVAANDRRFRVIMNADTVATPAYFKAINDMLNAPEDKDYWAKHVWRYLRQRNVKHEEMLKPSEMTKAKEAMIIGNMSVLDAIIHSTFAHWPFKLITVPAVKVVVNAFSVYTSDMPPNRKDSIILKKFREVTKSLHGGHKYRVTDHVTRLSFLVRDMHDPEIVRMAAEKANGKITTMHRDFLADDVDGKIKKLIETVREELEYNDLI